VKYNHYLNILYVGVLVFTGNLAASNGDKFAFQTSNNFQSSIKPSPINDGSLPSIQNKIKDNKEQQLNVRKSIYGSIPLQNIPLKMADPIKNKIALFATIGDTFHSTITSDTYKDVINSTVIIQNAITTSFGIRYNPYYQKFDRFFIESDFNISLNKYQTSHVINSELGKLDQSFNFYTLNVSPMMTLFSNRNYEFFAGPSFGLGIAQFSNKNARDTVSDSQFTYNVGIKLGGEVRINQNIWVRSTYKFSYMPGVNFNAVNELSGINSTSNKQSVAFQSHALEVGVAYKFF
jgi:opacity protein-like surface antigen